MKILRQHQLRKKWRTRKCAPAKARIPAKPGFLPGRIYKDENPASTPVKEKMAHKEVRPR
jgi:hypothetical protein